MGQRSRQSRGRTPEADGERSSDTEGDDNVQRWPSDSAVGPNTAGPATKEEVEAYYGCEVSSAKEYKELQRLEKAYGGQVLRWADEGIPLDAMGDHSKIRRFRERRDSEIPYDIEEFNQDSLDENTGRVARRVRESPDGKTDVPDTVREVISSPGRSLDSSIQRAVEERMGDSLGDVRIHTGPKAAEAADQIDARAFTVGNHVAFGAGEYDPESAEGQHVLAHELAHVRQQTGGDLSMLPQEDVQLEIDPDPELEREAEETAQRVMSGGKLGIQKLSDTEVHLQRTYQGHVPPRHVGGRSPIPGSRGGGDDEGLTDRIGEWIEEKVDEATTKRYSLTKQQLQTVATQLDSVSELRTFLDDHDIEAVSGLQDAFGSAFSMASKFGKAGSFVAGPAAGVASIPVGYYLSEKYGMDVADRVQTFMREQLGLSTDQVFDSPDATASQTSAGTARGE